MFSTQIDGVGVTEFQLLGTIVVLSVPIFGETSPFYPVFGIPFGTFFAYLILCLGSMNVYTTVSRTLIHIPKKDWLESSKFVLPLIPIIISLFTFQFLEIYKKHTIEIMVLNGLVFSFLTAEQIIITTTKSPKLLYHANSFYYMIVAILCLFLSYSNQVILVSLYAFVILVRYLRYVIGMTKQLMEYLNIPF